MSKPRTNLDCEQLRSVLIAAGFPTRNVDTKGFKELLKDIQIAIKILEHLNATRISYSLSEKRVTFTEYRERHNALAQEMRNTLKCEPDQLTNHLDRLKALDRTLFPKESENGQ